ncbi:MAG TPA: F0F1 ATP synthase subunit epsilon [Moorella mulderi]|nr:F0F1 ATP synthase subunit epsilon [Moorella mulderi]
MASLILEVITPLKKVLEEEVESVVVPASEGYMGVLPRHFPALALLRPGVLTYRPVGGALERMAISGGFVEVGPRKVLVLADAAEMPGEIDVERARRAMERARERLRRPHPGIDIERARLALERAKARLKVAETR